MRAKEKNDGTVEYLVQKASRLTTLVETVCKPSPAPKVISSNEELASTIQDTEKTKLESKMVRTNASIKKFKALILLSLAHDSTTGSSGAQPQ